ncbi:MEDS domain-containing protein [Domibacillus sp. A3M-37]|uniref:MEDS domain-containing protein n=1 Tax=Domibacillus sp. A3M-37 TaxID=2962037 RepID=UPI0020B8A6AE|nr:MEDS domain-containing protein [Domibacillus sp. A3M-37]MCP3760889.1 MEDS domain-containing protein [Domibacillus sp. A3M-37]
MGENIMNVTKKLVEASGHIAYCFHDLDTYITNAAAFVIAGVEKGEHVLVVENNKITPMIHKKLCAVLTDEQRSLVLMEDNFMFYFLHQTFNPVRIYDHFVKLTAPYLIDGSNGVRTWGHVQWATDENIQAVGQYEKELNRQLANHPITAVCAYDEKQVTPELKSMLIETREYMMTDFDWEKN